MTVKDVDKTLFAQLAALDDYGYLLRRELIGLYNGEWAHLRTISGICRNLLCEVSGCEGLLWRLTEELDDQGIGISDSVLAPRFLHESYDDSIYEGLVSAYTHIPSPVRDHPSTLADLPTRSLRRILKKEITLVESAYNGMTNELVIKEFASHSGVPHELPSTDPGIASLSQVSIKGIPPYAIVITTMAELAIQLGERVLDRAGDKLSYHRKRRSDSGESTIVVLTRMIPDSDDEVHMMEIWEPLSEFKFKLYSIPKAKIRASLTKRGGHTSQEWSWSRLDDGDGGIAAVRYSSARCEFTAWPEEKTNGLGLHLGWVDAHFLKPIAKQPDVAAFFFKTWLSDKQLDDLANGPFDSTYSQLKHASPLT